MVNLAVNSTSPITFYSEFPAILFSEIFSRPAPLQNEIVYERQSVLRDFGKLSAAAAAVAAAAAAAAAAID